LIDGVEWMNQ